MCTQIWSGVLLIFFGADELWAKVLVRKCIRTWRKPSLVSALYLLQREGEKETQKKHKSKQSLSHKVTN